MDWSFLGNPVVIAVAGLLVLSLVRLNVAFALMLAAFLGGMAARMSPPDVVNAFFRDLNGGAVLALNYALLGALSVAVSQSGIIEYVAEALFRRTKQQQLSRNRMAMFKYGILAVVAAFSVSSQNLIPVHIAFIPILIPPLLMLFNHLKIDRRAVACILTFGLITPYMVLPFGFGKIYLEDILIGNVVKYGLDVTPAMASKAMVIPALGMVAGVLIAVFYSYRKPREYQELHTEITLEEPLVLRKKSVAVGIAALMAAFAGQILFDKMAFAALLGIVVFLLCGEFRIRDTQDLFTRGVFMMGGIGMVMIAASGFVGVMEATGGIPQLIGVVSNSAGGSRAVLIFCMLLIGLLVTMGIGSSFATIPLLAMIYVPLCIEVGLSPLATIAVVGSAGALGDAGSPVSESVLGPTAGLNADGQHDHIWDSTIPTFIHFNLPLLVSGWIGGMCL